MVRCGVLAVVVWLATLSANAQGPAPKAPHRAFDVISIKSAAGTPKFCKYLQDRVLCQISLLHLIKEAYQVHGFQLDAPKWMGDPEAVHDSDRIFTFEGTMPTGTSVDAARLMLRQALADRFDVKVHLEKRTIAAYALIPGKQGVKLQPARDPSNPQLRTIETPSGKLTGFLVAAPGVYMASAITLDFFALELEHRADLDRPVVNMTGLTAKYDVELHWEPTPQPRGIVTQADPEFLTAVRSQLGLQVEKRDLPIEVLVVDHAESVPSPN